MTQIVHGTAPRTMEEWWHLYVGQSNTMPFTCSSCGIEYGSMSISPGQPDSRMEEEQGWCWHCGARSPKRIGP